MTWTSGILVYVVIWWLVIFTVLPWGNSPIDRADIAKGQASSAPKHPRLGLKMLINTVLSGAIWLGLYWVMESGLVSVR